jgi:hypothetical protein
VKDAIKATVPTTIGTTLVLLKAKASPISVNGVDDVTIFRLDTHATPDNEESNLVPGETEIYNLDSANISVTVVNS